MYKLYFIISIVTLSMNGLALIMDFGVEPVSLWLSTLLGVLLFVNGVVDYKKEAISHEKKS